MHRASHRRIIFVAHITHFRPLGGHLGLGRSSTGWQYGHAASQHNPARGLEFSQPSRGLERKRCLPLGYEGVTNPTIPKDLIMQTGYFLRPSRYLTRYLRCGTSYIMGAVTGASLGMPIFFYFPKIGAGECFVPPRDRVALLPRVISTTFCESTIVEFQ